jgi:3-dehydroquinate dehydratase/shikimate dehydrogenase
VPARTLVVQSIACETTEATLRAYLAPDPRADLIELRLDAVRDLDPDRLLQARGKPKLITIRSRQQGGGARPPDREALLRRALEAGVEYLDLEFGDHDLPFLKRAGHTRRILSCHLLETTPADLPALYRRIRSVAEGALIKIVTFADAATDNLRMRDLLRSADPGGLIAFCMGPKGVPSRILAGHWGSAAVYAPARGGAPTAPGQVSLEDLFDLYRWDRIDPETRLLGVVGYPIGHSLSPLIHNVALGAMDLNFRYLPFEATTLAEFLPLASELRVSGLSVTLPHKEKFLSYLDDLDETARAVGAVNTVVKTWNRLEGRNTDVEAALEPVRRRGVALKGSRVAVLGAGGAARALVYGLVRDGARVAVFNRTAGRARELARRFGARALPWGRLRGFACDLLVNATSVGLAPDSERTPLPASWVSAPMVYDIIYNPPETLFLREARARGAEVIGGVEMFVAQGAAQFRMFTGREPPLELMERTVLGALGASPATSDGPVGRRTLPTGRGARRRVSGRRQPGRRARGRRGRR